MTGRAHPIQRGFGLVELMVALVLGMIVVIGALSLFSSNRAASRATEGLSRVQQNARVGFELMARDVRDAGSTPCSKNIPIGNVLNGSAGNWVYDWGSGIQGFGAGNAISGLPASGVGSRVAGTDGIIVHSGGSEGVSIAEHQPNSAQFKVNTTAHGLSNGDVVVVCDYRQATLVQITGANSSNVTLVHNPGAGSPGNCTKGFGLPIDCTGNPLGNPYVYPPNSIVSRLTSVAWYIGNGATGPALFRKYMNRVPDEIAPNVTGLQLSYLREDPVTGVPSYVDAATVTAAGGWPEVTAVQIRFTTASPDRVGTDGNALSRPVIHYAALRNRNP